MNKNRSVVTGGAGFIGSHLVAKLVKLGHQVTVIDDLSSGLENRLPLGVELIRESVENIKDSSLLSGVDYVFHLAAMSRSGPSLNEMELCHKSNVLGTWNLLEMVKTSSVKKFVYAASSTCYGSAPVPHTLSTPPMMLNPYGWSKYAGEQLALMYGSAFSIPVLSLRLFNVYGKFQPHEGPYALVIGTFLQKLRDGETIVIHGDGKQRRDFVHVSDVADCMLAAAFSTLKNNFYNVGSGTNVSISELAKYFPVKTEFGPRRFGDAKETLADISETVADLSWSPRISLSQGIQELIDDGTPS